MPRDMEKVARTGLYFAGVIALLFVAFYAFTLAQTERDKQQAGEERTLNVDATGRVSAVPDVGTVTFTVMTEGKTPEATQDENAQKANAIIAFLKNEGVADKDIKTSQFSLSPKYYYPYQYPRIPCPLHDAAGLVVSCPPVNQVLIGYTLSQSITVKIRDFDKAGAILSGAIERGANSVGALYFSVEDIDQYKKEARAQALTKAREQADELAELGGFKIDKLLSIHEGSSYVPQPLYRNFDAQAIGAPVAEIASPDIEQGSQDVTVTLTVIFKIK